MNRPDPERDPERLKIIAALQVVDDPVERWSLHDDLIEYWVSRLDDLDRLPATLTNP